jgi:hypothetical protein
MEQVLVVAAVMGQPGKPDPGLMPVMVAPVLSHILSDH